MASSIPALRGSALSCPCGPPPDGDTRDPQNSPAGCVGAQGCFSGAQRPCESALVTSGAALCSSLPSRRHCPLKEPVADSGDLVRLWGGRCGNWPGQGKWLPEGHTARQSKDAGGPRAPHSPPCRPDFLEVTQRDSRHRKEVGKGSPARWIPGHHLVSSKPPPTSA